MEIKLYSTDSNANVLNKKLTLVNTIDGVITDYEQNYDNVRLNLHTSDIFNYIYIPSFNKYYFVDNIEMAENGMNFYECRCDLLMSFSDVVKNSIIKIRGNTTVIHSSDIQIDRTPTNIFIVLNRVSDNDGAL